MGWGAGIFIGAQWGNQQQRGLPFAGVPEEYRERVEALLAKEPPSTDELHDVAFSYQTDEDAKTFNLGRFLAPKWLPILGIAFIVGLETISQQIGPRLTQEAIDHGFLKHRFSVVLWIVVAYLGILVVGTALSALRLTWSGSVGGDLLYRLRVRIFRHIEAQSLDYFTTERAGRILTRVTSDIDNLMNLFQQGLVNMLLQIGTLIFVIAQMFSMNLRLSLWVVLTVLPVLTVMSLWFRSTSDYGFLAVRDWQAAVMADLQENLSGMRVVVAHNRQRYNLVQHRNLMGEYRAANLYTAKVSGRYAPAALAIGVLANGLVLLIGGRMVLHHSLTLGTLTAFILYLNSFFFPIQQLVQLYTTYQQGRASILRINELFRTHPTVKELPDAAELPPIHGQVRLEDVTFGYAPDNVVLHDVDLTIEAGETFALVGPTGAGKSTVAKLVTRFYDPLSGRVTVDGHDVAKVSIESLRRQLGVVPQEPFLFAGTIGDNISFARPDATRDEILEACRAVGILDLVEALPDGLDTPCHERGVTLSSGERQLIALARAFLASPRVLILDEATSSLDLATESMVEAALDVLLEGRTAILIAHRLNTAMRADRIGVVADGRLVEVGSHEELLLLGGRYAEMFALWRSHQSGGTGPVMVAPDLAPAGGAS